MCDLHSKLLLLLLFLKLLIADQLLVRGYEFNMKRHVSDYAYEQLTVTKSDP